MFLVARMLGVAFACALLCLSVVAAHADNVSRARSIVQNLDDNHFTEVQENGGKIFMFAARDLAYMIQYFPPNGKGPACAITEEYKAVKTIYYDVGCDGSA